MTYIVSSEAFNSTHSYSFWTRARELKIHYSNAVANVSVIFECFVNSNSDYRFVVNFTPG